MDLQFLILNLYCNREKRLHFKEGESENLPIRFFAGEKIMRAKITTLVLLFVFGFVAAIDAQAKNQIKVKINQQQTVAKTKLTIKFASLVEDSRCPTDAQCIQAGDARIQIEVKNGKGLCKTFEIGTNDKQNSIVFAGYTIRLIDLDPHPASNIRIDRNGYTAIFDVGKKGN